MEKKNKVKCKQCKAFVQHSGGTANLQSHLVRHHGIDLSTTSSSTPKSLAPKLAKAAFRQCSGLCRICSNHYQSNVNKPLVCSCEKNFTAEVRVLGNYFFMKFLDTVYHVNVKISMEHVLKLRVAEERDDGRGIRVQSDPYRLVCKLIISSWSYSTGTIINN